MKIFVATIALVAALLVGGHSAAYAGPASPHLSCTIGPATRTFGGSQWLVYGCDDGKSVILVSAPGSAAMPFVFSFIYTNTGMRLDGQGTGNKASTNKAYAALKKLTQADVAALYRAAKQHATGKRNGSGT